MVAYGVRAAPLGFAVLLGLAGCAAGQEGQAAGPRSDSSRDSVADAPVYETVSALNEHAQLVVVGTPTEIVGREFDGGGNDESMRIDGERIGNEVIFYSLDVGSVLTGDAPEKIIVGWPDPAMEAANSDSEGSSGVTLGEQLVLFLRFVPAEESPGITSVDDIYVRVGGEEGVFDVDGEAAVARSPEVRGLDKPESDQGRFRVNLSDLASFVRGAN